MLGLQATNNKRRIEANASKQHASKKLDLFLKTLCLLLILRNRKDVKDMVDACVYDKGERYIDLLDAIFEKIILSEGILYIRLYWLL